MNCLSSKFFRRIAPIVILLSLHIPVVIGVPKDKPAKVPNNTKGKDKGQRTELIRIKGLGFGEAVAGLDSVLTTEAADRDAAEFEIYGIPWGIFTLSTVDTEVTLILKGGGSNQSTIIVDNFSMGGSLQADGRGVLDQNGYLGNVRIGASAHIKSDTATGNYSGTSTLRLTYH